VDDATYLARAIELASLNVGEGGGPFGAVVVRGDKEVGAGTNRVTRDLDPTAHAEVVAIREASARLGDFSLAGCTLYASCEPCPMCLASALWARVDRVVYAAGRDDASRAGFDDSAFYALFEKPRSEWSLRVEEQRLPSAAEPFEAWLADEARTEY